MSNRDPRILEDLNRYNDLEQYKHAVAAMNYYGARVGVACGDSRAHCPCSRIAGGISQNCMMGHPASLPNTKLCSQQEADKRIRGVLPPTLAAASSFTYSHNAADCYYVRPEELLSEDSSRDEVSSVQNYSSEECFQRAPEPDRQRGLTHPTKRSHSSPVKYCSNANMPEKARNILLSQSQFKTKIPVAEPNRICLKETNAAYFAPNPPCAPITAFKSAPLPARSVVKHRCLNMIKAERPMDAETIKLCERAIADAVKSGNSLSIPQAALKVIPPRKSPEAVKDKTSWRRRIDQLKSNRRAAERRPSPASRKGSREDVRGGPEIAEAPRSQAPTGVFPNPCSFETTCSEDSQSVCSKITLCDESVRGGGGGGVGRSNATIKGSGSDIAQQTVSEKPEDLAGTLLADIERRFSGQDNLCCDLKAERVSTSSKKSGERVAADILGCVRDALGQRLEERAARGVDGKDGAGGAGIMVSCDEAKLSVNLSALARRFVERKPSKYDSQPAASPETYNTTASLKPPLVYVHEDFVDRIEVISPERHGGGGGGGGGGGALRHGTAILEESIDEASSQPPGSGDGDGDERSGYAHSTNTGLGFIAHNKMAAAHAHTAATYSRASSRSDLRTRPEDGAGANTDASTSYERLRDAPSRSKGVQATPGGGSGGGGGGGTRSDLQLNARSSHMSAVSLCHRRSRHESRAEKSSAKKCASGRRLIADLEKSQRMLNLVDAALKDEDGTSSDGMGDTVLRVRSRKLVAVPRSTFDVSRSRCSDCARPLAPAECVRQLQVLRNEHIRHIQREIQQIANLNQFLDNFDIQPHPINDHI